MTRSRWTAAVLLVVSGTLAGLAAVAATPATQPANAGRLRAEQCVARGLAFLENAQRPDGGWPGFEGSDPAITALVAKAFAEHERYGPNHPVVRRAFDFIMRHRQDDGGIYVPGIGLRNYYTSVAVMALARSDEPRVKEAVAAAQRMLTGLQWDESEEREPSDVFYGGAGYGHGKRPDLSNTQMMLEALHDSALSPEHPVYHKALIFISRCQMLPATNDQPFAADGDGGFIYSPANGGESKAGTVERDGRQVLRCYGSMTYAGYKSLLYAGLSDNDPRVRAAWDWFGRHYTLERNPNMPDDQALQGLYYYYHVFARALEASGKQLITDAAGERHDWRADLSAALARRQRDDGSWVNEEDRWYESNPHLVTAYSVLALEAALR